MANIKKPDTDEVDATHDYKKMYEEMVNTNKTLTLKIEEYEKIMKTIVEKAAQTDNTLKSATLEYNARVKYMLDCVKHAYMSMQFAVQATNKTKEDN